MDTEPSTWRLLIDEQPRSGAANMALDQAIAEACAAGDSLPTLRFYRWQPPTITLGRHQSAADIDHIAAHRAGYDIVRRSTGGRAILHVDELTYSVTAPMTEARVQGNVMDAYLRISEALVAGLEAFGVEVEKADRRVRAGKDVSAACFEVPSAYELTAGGRKLVGSAQSRRKGYVLQHGSLPLYGDITRLIDVLALDDGTRDGLKQALSIRAGTLAQAYQPERHQLLTPVQPAVQSAVSSEWFSKQREEDLFQAVAAYLQHGFEQVLHLKFVSQQPTSAELERCSVLMRETFANDDWNNKK
ncbi:MAG: lipoate--protein ligase family protein [Chloroflexota bacterium]